MKYMKLLPLIGIALFAYILWNVDIPTVLAILSILNPYYLVLALAIQPIVVLIKAFKWKALTKSFSVDLPLGKAASAWLIGFAIGIITPGRVGDFTRAYYIRDDIGIGKSLSTVFVDRVIDVAVLVVLSALGLGIFVSLFATGGGFDNLFLFLIGFIALFFTGILVITRKGLMTKLGLPFFRILVPHKFKQRFRDLYRDSYEGLEGMERKWVLISVIIGIVAWVFTICQIYVISIAMGLQVPFIALASIIPIFILMDALPISFSGIGTRDAAIIFFFSFLALTPEVAVSFSLIILIFDYVLTAAAGLVLWTRNPISITRSHSLRPA